MLHGATSARRVISLVVWLAVATLVAWAVVRAVGLENGFPLVPLIAYTPLAGLAAVLVMLVAGVLRLWAAAGVAGAVALLIAISFSHAPFRRTSPASPPMDPSCG